MGKQYPTAESFGAAAREHAHRHRAGAEDPVTPEDIGAAEREHADWHATGGADPVSPQSIGAADRSHAQRHHEDGPDAVSPEAIGAADRSHADRHRAGGEDEISPESIAAADRDHDHEHDHDDVYPAGDTGTAQDGRVWTYDAASQGWVAAPVPEYREYPFSTAAPTVRAGRGRHLLTRPGLLREVRVTSPFGATVALVRDETTVRSVTVPAGETSLAAEGLSDELPAGELRADIMALESDADAEDVLSVVARVEH